MDRVDEEIERINGAIEALGIPDTPANRRMVMKSFQEEEKAAKRGSLEERYRKLREAFSKVLPIATLQGPPAEEFFYLLPGTEFVQTGFRVTLEGEYYPERAGGPSVANIMKIEGVVWGTEEG